MLKEKRLKSKGITLISLVVTIIILIILAGVSLNIILGENGIVIKSKIASESYNKEAATEAMNLKITNVQISKYAEEQRMPTLKELADNFSQDKDFEYVQETSEIASSSKIISENPTSIYTKLKAYSYEFEINSSLQLASIDGVQVEDTNQDTINSLLARIEKLEQENETLKESLVPGSITSDAIIMTSSDADKTVSTRNLLQFTNNFSENFEQYFSYNQTTGELICNKDGWYSIYLYLDVTSNLNTWTNTNLRCLINQVNIGSVSTRAQSSSTGQIDTNNICMYMKRGDIVEFYKNTSGTAPNYGNNATIRIYKLN